MGDLYLIFFVPESLATEDIYNPSAIPSFRAPLAGEVADKLNVKEPSAVLVRKLGNGQYEIIRRTKYPYSHNDFVALISTGDGSGEGTSKPVVDLGNGDVFQPGTPIGAGEMGGNLAIWALIALAVLVMINSK